MNERIVWIAAAIAMLALVGVVFLWPTADDDPADDPAAAVDSEAPSTDEPPPDVVAETIDPTPVVLYFPGASGRLYAETRMVIADEDLEARATATLEALLAGPENVSLRAPLPAGVQLRRAYAPGEGLLIVDFESPEGVPPPASGSMYEMLVVYSLVDTLVLNFEEVDRVLLLWNGEQRRTFGGHLDTSRPLRPAPQLISTGPVPNLPPEPVVPAPTLTPPPVDTE